jgi:hypothetical protein
MIWEREPGPLHAKRAMFFRFRLEDADGKPAHDVELYMGMPGHAAFVRRTAAYLRTCILRDRCPWLR